jgi:hypothetical protein
MRDAGLGEDVARVEGGSDAAPRAGAAVQIDKIIARPVTLTRSRGGKRQEGR